MAQRETDSLRLLLIGATGAGKSCTGNTIFFANDEIKERIFRDNMVGQYSTIENEEVKREVLGRQVTIIDTPGLRNEGEAQNAKEIVDEVKGAIQRSKKPFEAFLFVVNIFRDGLQMDDLTLQVINDISRQISYDFWRYAVIVFTYEDNFWKLQKRERGIGFSQFSVHEYVDKSRVSRKKYAIGRVVEENGIQAIASINNEEEDREKIKEKVADLFHAIDHVRRENGYRRFGKEKLNPDPKPKKNDDFCSIL